MKMADSLKLLVATAALALGACSAKSTDETATTPEPTAPAASEAQPTAPPSAPDSKFGNPPPADTVATVFGRGTYAVADGKEMSYTFDVNFSDKGVTSGALQFSMFDGAEKMDVTGTVTCGHYDLTTKRVWIGGEIDSNRSTLVTYQTERFGTGQPVWFRFLESDTHPEPAAKMSAPGFAGDDKFDDAAQFCEKKPWLAGNGGLNDITAQSAVIVFALPEAS